MFFTFIFARNVSMLARAVWNTSEGRSYHTLRHRSTCALPSLMPENIFVIIFHVIILFHLVRFLPRPLEPASWRALPPGDCPAGGEEGAPPWLPGAVNMRMCWVDIMHQESWLCTKLDTHLKWRLRVELRGGVSSWGPQAFTTGL